MAKKEIYFKIIELPEYQVLISKEQDEDIHTLNVTFHMDDLKLNYALGYDKKDVDKHFNKFDEKIAQEFIDQAIKSLQG